jgi:glycosyltransferase involved in cell wall biosynthesis
MISLITVIIPTYNRGPSIATTIDSVLAQTIIDQTEIIVIDDGSTDDTRQFLQIEYSKYAQIRVIHQENAGVAKARNRGLEEARGEFVAFLDHDDIWLPQKLELQCAAFRDRPQVGVVCCRWRDTDLEGRFVEASEEAWVSRKMPSNDAYQTFLRYNAVVSMSVPMIRTSLLRQIGGFDAKAAPCDDWDLWLRLSRLCHFFSLDQTLVLYRRHEQQQSQTSKKMAQRSQYVLRKQFPFVWRNPIKLWTAVTACAFIDTVELYTQAKHCLFAKQWRKAAQIILRAALRNPLALFSIEWLYLMKRFAKRDSRPY